LSVYSNVSTFFLRFDLASPHLTFPFQLTLISSAAMTYARSAIARIAGYVPGEQPQGKPLIKLNTNENPYPPSAKVIAAAREFDFARLRLYPEPSARIVREAAADLYGFTPEHVVCGNGSDDLLTIALRTFVDQGGKLAFTTPSYSLYPVLADLQGATCQPVELDSDFNLPANAAELAGDAPLFILARPNAPTGTNTPKDGVRKLCRQFPGVVWIDEAYVDFSDDNCLDLAREFPNVVVSRTLSKSYSLAGLRLGLAIANPDLILEMNKVRDSYNVDMLTQVIGAAALRDSEAMRANASRIVATRAWLAAELTRLGAEVLPSAANFLFAKPLRPAADVFADLRARGFLVRYFNLPRISEYIRITIGRQTDMEAFVKAFAECGR
jgi:histidinol-phosphate aminotransferase